MAELHKTISAAAAGLFLMGVSLPAMACEYMRSAEKPQTTVEQMITEPAGQDKVAQTPIPADKATMADATEVAKADTQEPVAKTE